MGRCSGPQEQGAHSSNWHNSGAAVHALAPQRQSPSNGLGDQQRAKHSSAREEYFPQECAYVYSLSAVEQQVGNLEDSLTELD